MLALFPLPTHLVLEALNHPSFKDESALIDAILAGNVPPELGLKAAVEDTNAPKPSQTNAARSGWSAEDVARLKVKNENSTPVAQEIPDTLRASILRLVEAQKEEEEAAARAIAEAHGEEEDDDDGEPRPPRMTAADGEESGEEQEGPVEGRKADSTQTLLELAYLRTPGVFARDAETRRSKGREELRDATGMDDSQIEGWRIMLERNVGVTPVRAADSSRIKTPFWRGISLVGRRRWLRRRRRRRVGVEVVEVEVAVGKAITTAMTPEGEDVGEAEQVRAAGDIRMLREPAGLIVKQHAWGLGCNIVACFFFHVDLLPTLPIHRTQSARPQ